MQKNILRIILLINLLFITVFVTSPASAAVSFRSATSAAATVTAGAGGSIIHEGAGNRDRRTSCGNITPTIPGTSNTVNPEDDLLFALVTTRENSANISAPLGWNQYFTDNYSTPNEEFEVFIYWRFVGTTNPSTTFTQENTGSCSAFSGRISRFSGIDTTTPFDNTANPINAGQWSRQDSGNLNTGTGAVTTTSNNAMLIVAGFVADNRRVSQAGSWGQSFDDSWNTTRDVGVSLFYQLQTTAGLKNISDWSWDLQGNGNDPNYAAIFALRPAPVGGTPTLTINQPTGTTFGDVMLASVSTTPNTITVTTPPTGWTLLPQVNQPAATTSTLKTYYKVATTSEPSSYIWTFDSIGFSGAVGGIASFIGVDNAIPIDANTGNSTASSTSHTAPDITTTLDGGMLVTSHEYTSSGTWTPPLSMTEMVDIAYLTPDNASGISMEMNYEERLTAGATGTRTATASGNADSGASHSISLNPSLLSCYTDDFNRTNGSPGTDWVVSNNSGGFGNPVIFNNRLRMTDASGNVATMATLQQIFPGAGNRIEVEFDFYAYGGSGADGIAVILSDFAVTPVPGGYGGSLGYAQRTGINGFAGGWLGVGLDEYGNFSNPTEGRVGGPGFRQDSISIRGSGSGTGGYAYHAGTAANLVPEVDNNGAASPAHRYRIIIDHSNGINAWVSVERDTTGSGTNYVTLVAPYDAKAQAGQVAVPTTWILSYTGSTGGSTNIHEIDSLRVCATAQAPASGYDHIRIEHDGEGLTCDVEQVTIRACVDAACSTEFSSSVTATLTPDGDTVTFTGNTTGNIRRSTTGIAILSANTILPAPNNGVRCFNGATETCDMNFVDTGFRFTDGANPPNPINIGTQIAGKASDAIPGNQTIALQAVRTDTNTGACVGVFADATNVNVEMASQCNNPAACIAASKVNITNNSITTAINNNPDTAVTSYSSVPLLFTTNSQAILNFAYPDVGQIKLYARYNILDGSGTPTGNFMSGSSNAFVVKPATFVVTNILKPDDSANPANTAATDIPYFVKAGTDFKATIEARDINGNITPNYGNESVPEGILLTPALVGGLGLTTNPAITNNTISGNEFGSSGAIIDADGVASVINLSWPEVGIITITPSVADADYLGAGTVTGTITGNVGRFIPAYFDVIATESCIPGGGATNFTYSGQGFKVDIAARSNGGGTTINYAGDFVRASEITNAGATANFTNNDFDDSHFTNGIGTRTDVTYTFGSKETIPLAMTSIRAIDTDLVTSDTYAEGSNLIRSGRARLENVFGPELSALTMPIRTEFYSDNTLIYDPSTPATIAATQADDGFIVNTDDTCTSYDATSGTLANYTGNLSAGETTVTGATAFSAGLANITFSAPGAGNEGSVNLLADNISPWLAYPWGVDCDGDSINDTGACGTVSFGLYRGDDRIIYWREVF